MKATIVTCPVVVPSSPPLGAAMLKGYVETNSSHCVSCLDLNLEFILYALDNLDQIKDLVGIPGGVAGLKHRLFWWSLMRRDIAETVGSAVFKFHRRRRRFGDFLRDKAAVAAAVNAFQSGGDEFFNLGRFAEHETILPAFMTVLLALAGPLWLHATRGCKPVEKALLPWVERIEQTEPELVGFSVLLPEQLDFSLAAARVLKSRSNVKIVFGGARVNGIAERLLETFPFIDYVLSGAGEMGLTQLLDGGDETAIANLTTRRDGAIRTNDYAGCGDNFRAFGRPDFSDADFSRYLAPEPCAAILTSRGCYWRRCAFCTHHKSYMLKYHPRKPEDVVEDVRAVHERYGVRHFQFVDEMISPNAFDRISKAILAAGLDIRYLAYVKPVKEFTPELLAQMRASGCIELYWGVESANPRVLELMEKGIRVEDAKTVVQNSHAAGIRNILFIIFGFPTESRDEALDTVAFLADHRACVDGVLCSAFFWSHGSPIDEAPEKFGITVKRTPSRLDPQHPWKGVGPILPAEAFLNRNDKVTWEAPPPAMAAEERRALYNEYDHYWGVRFAQLVTLRDHSLVYFGRHGDPRRDS